MKNHVKKGITLGDSGGRGISIYGARWKWGNDDYPFSAADRSLIFCVEQGRFQFQVPMTPEVMREMGATLIDMANTHVRMCAEEDAEASEQVAA